MAPIPSIGAGFLFSSDNATSPYLIEPTETLHPHPIKEIINRNDSSNFAGRHW